MFDQNSTVLLLDRVLFHSHLHPGEHLVYVVHKHWWVISGSLVKIGFFGWLFPIMLFLLFPGGFWIFVIWFLIAFISFLYLMINWYFDALLVTSHGLVDLDWRGFFDKTLARIEFEGVEGVEYTKTGFWATILNFGHLVIEAEGHHLGLSFTADPQAAEHAILHAKEHALEEKSFESEEALKQILADVVASHMRKKKGGEELADLL